jgi:hypothetical protein
MIYMKKIPILLIIVSLLSACSMTVNEFLGIQPTAVVVPTFFTNTPTDVPTFTPTVPSPTFTATPTMIGQKKKTATPEFTATPLILTPLGVTLLPSSTPIQLVPQVSMPGFVSVSVSDEAFYKGKECLPISVKFTAQVANPSEVAFVLLFVRFKSKQSGVTSEWTDSIAMQHIGGGTYTHDLVTLEMKAVDSFENAWVQYQIASTDANGKLVTKTDIFSERLTLLECVLTPTPTASITPTVLVP